MLNWIKHRTVYYYSKIVNICCFCLVNIRQPLTYTSKYFDSNRNAEIYLKNIKTNLREESFNVREQGSLLIESPGER